MPTTRSLDVSRLLLRSGLLLGLAFLAGCNNQGSTAGSGNGDEILVGHYGSMTGPEATFGQSTDNGIRLAVEELNAAGGINGRQVKLITYDDKGDVKEAGSAVTRLVSRDNVVAVLGEVASGLSLAGAPVCQENQVPMISPSSTNPRVTKVGVMIFRVCFIDPFQGYVCAKFARDPMGLNATKAAILYDQAAPYSVGLAQEFDKAFTALGGTVTTQQTYSAGDSDFTAQLTTIRGTEPDVVFVPGYYTDVGNIALQKDKLGIKAPMLGGDGWDSVQLTEIAGKTIEGSCFSNHYSRDDPAPRVQNFVTKYKERFGSAPDGLAALGYDAAMLLFDAMQRAESLEGAQLAKAISDTRDFAGVTGTISINADRDAVKPAVILRMVDGKPTYVTTIEPEQ
jgi:branched-chain amino acid transport system substrate-binding protein